MKKLLTYLSFRGRANRARYWLFIAAFWGILIAWSIGVAAIHSVVGEGDTGLLVLGLVSLLILPLFVALFIALLANAVRRLHDRGKSAWWLLLFAGVPAVLLLPADAIGTSGAAGASELAGLLAVLSLPISIWAFVELGCLAGTKGPNKYGEDPLGQPAVEVFA